MRNVFDAAAELQAICQREGWRFCFIGGVAVQRWGQPRFTADADLSLLTGFGGEETYIDKLLSHFRPRMADAANFAARNRVLLLFATNGVGIDVALAALPFEEKMIARASPFTFPTDLSLITCSAEDLVIMKAFAGRAQDWFDLENVIIRQGTRLDWPYIIDELKPLLELKGAPEVLDRLKGFREENR